MKIIDDPLFAQNEVPIRDKFVHKFKIKSVTGDSFEIENARKSPTGFRSNLLDYDRSGNRLVQQKYNREGQIIHEWGYDSNGRLEGDDTYEASGRISFRFEYLYDHDGNWNKKLMYLSGVEPHYIIIANRDVHGRILEGVYYDASDQRIRTDSYIYDDRDRLVGMSMGHMGEWVYEYNENDNLTRKTGDLPSASVFGESFEYQYDDQDLLIKTNHLYHSVTVFKYTFWV